MTESGGWLLKRFGLGQQRRAMRLSDLPWSRALQTVKPPQAGASASIGVQMF